MIALFKNGNLGFLLSAAMLLEGCGVAKPYALLQSGDRGFEAPLPDEVIPSRWVRVVSLGVSGRPAYDAHVEVGVRGRLGFDDVIRCELVTTHSRFRSDRDWSPLPMAFFSPSIRNPDGSEALNELFQQTFDFFDKRFGGEGSSFRTTFTRGKTFAAKWRLIPYLTKKDGVDVCEAVATIETSSQVACRNSWCAIREVVATVDTWRHLSQTGPPRVMDDLSSLELRLEDLDGQGMPSGASYSTSVPEFK